METNRIKINKMKENIEIDSYKRSNLDYAANAFIRAYIDEVTRIKKKRNTKRKKSHISLERKKILHLKMCICW